jgi:cytochrome P450
MPDLLNEAPVFDVSFASPEFVADGYAIYEQIRAMGPVVYAPGPLKGRGDLAPADGYLLTGYRTCSRVLTNTSKYRQPPEFFANKFGDLVFEGIDGPRHDEIRGAWAHEFQRETLREKRRAMLEEVIDESVGPFVDRVLSGETLDAVTQLHHIIPLSVVLNMLSLPKSDHEQLRQWATDMTGLEFAESTALINAYIGTLVDERTETRGPDLISMMIGSEAASTMTHGEIVANASQLIYAGASTTTALMSSCVVLLARCTDQRRALAADRSLLPRAVEEVLRFRGVTQLTAPRFVADGDAEIEGVRIPEGAQVVPIVGAANRDPDRWERAQDLDILREPKQHLGFGFGMHNCLGMNLARLEVQILLDRLLDRIPEWVLANDDDIDLSNPFAGIPSILITAP